MAFETSFMIVTWLAILGLTLGLVGVVRNLSLLSASIEQRLQSPRRPKAGDSIHLPHSLEAESRLTEHRALLFVQAECSSCVRAVRRLTTLVAECRDLELLVLWKADAHPHLADIGQPRAVDAFRALNIGITPFMVVADGSVVTMSSALGSEEALARAERFVIDHYTLPQGEGPASRTTVRAR